ncbi:MAG: hypothetical protein HYT48_01720 [Candidatus Vogelbacteria bacterium]|nr:hypothetical protein [Candidatus Vogelbacteria bacterium]
MAIFLGNDFKNMSKTLDREAYIEQTNQCLDYMRRECRGCSLYYKPHPNETDEYSFFDLDGFQVIGKEDNEIAEIFFWKNLSSIKYVFSIASTAVWSAYNLGLNAYTFIRPVEAVIGKDIASAGDYFDELPSSFFITNFDQPLRENRKILVPDHLAEGRFLRDLESGNDVWFLVGDPGMLVIYISFVNLIKKNFPHKKINLILPRHHRWGRVKEKHYRSYFNQIVSFPRSLYSLKPSRFIEIIKTILAIKRFKLPPQDVLLLFANSNLVENCFVSYFPNKKIAVQFKDYFEINYGLKESEILRGEKLKARFTSIMFNLIIEPILGLYRSIYLEYGDGRVINIVRFLKPATKIYDRIYLLC